MDPRTNESTINTEQTNNQPITPKKKHKSPSKIRRDLQRMFKYIEEKVRKRETKSVAIQTDTQSTAEEVRTVEDKKTKTNIGKKVWKYLHSDKSKTSRKDNPTSPISAKEETSSVGKEETGKREEQRRSDEEERETPRGIDPTPIYENFELKLRLSRLEDEKLLTTALKHLVRHLHPKGETITFPTLEEVDKITLKSSNLPTNPIDLKKLVDQVFDRRDEQYDLETTYKQFAKIHGRITYDPKQSWPGCQIHSRHP